MRENTSIGNVCSSWSEDRIPVGSEIFRTRPDRSWDTPNLIYNGYRVFFPGLKRPGRGVVHPSTSSADVKERAQSYLHSHSGPSWPVVGLTFVLSLIMAHKISHNLEILSFIL